MVNAKASEIYRYTNFDKIAESPGCFHMRCVIGLEANIDGRLGLVYFGCQYSCGL